MQLYPGVQSVAVVPLGLSDHGTIKDRFAPVTPVFSRGLDPSGRTLAGTVPQADPEKHLSTWRTNSIFRLAQIFRKPDYYDDFAQIEDGIGMVRNFLDEFETALEAAPQIAARVEGNTGNRQIVFPHICAIAWSGLMQSSDLRCKSAKLKIDLWARDITVAGLLAGGDFLSALWNRRSLGDFLIIPQEAVSRVDGIFVDDLSPADLSRRLGIPVYPSGRTVQEFFQPALSNW